MEKIREFLSVNNGYGDGYGTGYGDGYGTGYGYGYGYGDGYGDGDGYGYGDGDGYGDGSGDGYGDGSGDGSGDGYGDGSAYGDGYGDGCGYGDGYGIKSFNGRLVYQIDGISTLIDMVSHGIAKGFILNRDFSLTKCFVVKQGNLFAHGKTIREARDALLEKMFDDMSVEDRINAFVEAHDSDKAYPDTDFFDWHHRLTGSCLAGRKAFAADHDMDLTGSRTVKEFITLTENAYGGDIIRRLKDFYP